MQQFAPSNIEKSHSTFMELVKWRAETQPDRTAFIFLRDGDAEETMSYSQLLRKAQSIATKLQAVNGASDCALLLYRPGIEFIGAFLGCLFGGIAPIPLPPPRAVRVDSALPRLVGVVKDAKPTIALTTSTALHIAGNIFRQTEGLKELRLIATDIIPEDLGVRFASMDHNAESTAFLQYTSGSTRQPKGVMISHGNLMHNLSCISHCLGVSSSSRGVIWLPPYHDMGLIGGILLPVYTGFPVMLMSPTTFLRHPSRWLQAITKYKATISGGPGFGFDLCTRRITEEERGGLDLSSWEVAFVGAEPINPVTLNQFAEYFSSCGFKKEAFYPCYGLAESTLMVTGGVKLAGAQIRSYKREALQQNDINAETGDCGSVQTLVGCGSSIPGQQVRIVDPEALTLCESGQVGEIWVKGPSVSVGYWKQEASRHKLRAVLPGVNGEFLRTGDLGFVDGDELFITGRMDDAIIINGTNHHPQDIEWTVEESHTSIRANNSAAFGVRDNGYDRLIVIVELDERYVRQQLASEKQEIIGALKDRIFLVHGVSPSDIVLVRSGDIPRTPSGKIQRFNCRRSYLEGSLKRC
jgi:acyl-CoA synthetase (AMP-forming)/AMP-acid ligase II